MTKGIVVAGVLAILLVGSAYAQAKTIFELAKTGTPQDSSGRNQQWCGR